MARLKIKHTPTQKRRLKPRQRRHSSDSRSPRYQKNRRDKALKSVYGGSDGKLPNMKALDRRKGGQWIFIIVSAAIICLVGYSAWINRAYLIEFFQQQTQNSMTVEMRAPKHAQLLTPYSLSIALSSPQQDIEEATLSLFLPPGFIIEEAKPSFDNSPSESERQWHLKIKDFAGAAPIVVRGIFMGDFDSQKTFRAVLNYRPRNFTSEFQTNAAHSVLLNETPLRLSIDAPERVHGGAKHSYTLTVKNNSSATISNIKIQPPNHQAFVIDTVNDDLIIKELAPNAETSIELAGSFDTITEGVTNLRWKIVVIHKQETYTLAHTNHTVAIIQQPLVVMTELAGDPKTLQPGNRLEGTVRYHNKSSQAVKNAYITLTLDTPTHDSKDLLDWTRLDTTGSPNIKNKTIEWDPDSVPTLKEIPPNKAGVLSFSMPIKSSDEIDITALDQADIHLETKISSETQTITAQPIIIPLIADTSIAAGAIGIADTLVIQWTMEHHFHKLENVRVVANLFGNIEWLEQTDATHGQITYDRAHRLVEWTMPSFESTDGIATASFVLRLDNPDPTQTSLMGETSLTATDATAGLQISRRAAVVGMP